MRVRIRLFASFREAVGHGELVVEASESSTVGDLLSRLRAEHPELGAAAENAMLAVNQEYVGPDLRLHDGDELALIPPVSGGSCSLVGGGRGPLPVQGKS